MADEVDEPNLWRETVRDIYDKCHFGPDNMFTGNWLAKTLVEFIEERHPGYFTDQQSAR